MFPEAGGSSSFARHAFNELASFFAGWALTLDYIITIAISAFFVPHYLAAFFPVLHHNPGDIFGGIAVIAALAALNIRGLGESAKLNLILAVMDLGTQLLLVLVGFVVILDPHLLVSQVHLGTSPTYTELIFALSLAMVAYTGIETVSNMAEEAHDPGRDVPKAVNMVLVAVLAVYAGISVVALSALPIHHGPDGYSTLLGTKYEADPVLGIVNNLGLSGFLTTALRYYVGVLAATILFIATNAGLIGISRLSWSLSEHRQLPGAFSTLHRRFRTPAFTIIFYSVIAGVLLIPGQIDLLGNLYSFGAMLSFTTAHVSVVALRVRRPDVERPYRAPWNVRIRGYEIPLSACLGALGTFAAWVSVVVLHKEARTVGIPWMVAGMMLFVIYRRRAGLDLTSPAKIDRGQRPPDFIPLEYRSALVPIFGNDVSAAALASAARFVGGDATVDAVYIINVPAQIPLDGPLTVEEEHGRNVLEAARLIGKQSGLHVRTSLLRTRNPGRTLVDEARRLHAEVIYLADMHAPAAERGLGPTAQYLLTQRPCRIVVQTGSADGYAAARPLGSRSRIT
jgi:basic amino acid/polyamine antiporter, APA family